MENKQTKKAPLTIMLLMIYFLSLLLFPIGIVYASSVSLDTYNNYSNVIDDLSKDKNFNPDDYVVNNNDSNFYVLQVAESSSSELLVYVYQPSITTYGTAFGITLSTGINENFHPVRYKLTLLNSYGVFFKYRVENFEMLNDALRYYDISTIYRKYYEKIDGALPEGNTASEKGIEVAKRFTASTIENQTTYNCTDTEVVTVTDKYLFSLRVFDGHLFFGYIRTNTDLHCVAFNTNWNMDRLIEVEMEYKEVIYEEHYVSLLPDLIFGDFGDISLGRTYTKNKNEIEPTFIELNDKDVIGNDPFYSWVQNYSWNCIQTKDEFLKDNSIFFTEEEKKFFDNKQYVLSFATTPWTVVNSGMGYEFENAVEVFDVVLLRFKFEVDGKEFNLGVVDNVQTGSNIPLNSDNKDDGFRTLLVIVLLILLVIVLGPVLPGLFNIIIFIISLPFKFIKWLFGGTSKKGRY